MGGILVYALHDGEGNFNNNSLGAISEAAKLAAEIGGEAAALELPPFPEISDTVPVDELLGLLQRRLELLYRLTGQEGGS